LSVPAFADSLKLGEHALPLAQAKRLRDGDELADDRVFVLSGHEVGGHAGSPSPRESEHRSALHLAAEQGPRRFRRRVPHS
jgi:hypothetical protein